MTKRIVLFGGSFDPVHHGHLIIARAVAEQCGFERITLIPSGAPAHKPPPVAPGELRLEMLRSAVEGKPLYEVCDLEVRRAGATYTIDTVEELRRLHGASAELHWVIGADMLEDLHKWRRAGDLLEAAQFHVALRPPWDQRLAGILAGMKGHFGAGLVDRLAENVVRTPLIDISSTDIRRRVAAGLPIDFLAPPGVLAIIRRTGVYGKHLI
jgi:nicotinate-nucleotide adenylyltransferase